MTSEAGHQDESRDIARLREISRRLLAARDLHPVLADREFFDYFESAHAGTESGGAALERRARFIVGDAR